MDDSEILVSNKLMQSVTLKRWAIVALAKSGKSNLEERNTALAAKLRPYANKHNITVLVFGEFPFSKSEVNSWRRAFASIAEVKTISTYSRGYNLKERFGYKYMCKFFSLDMYEYLEGYDYYMRCDTDCVVNTLNYDILEWTETNKVGYGFAMRKIEAHGPTKQLLPVWTQKYIRNCAIQPTGLMDEPLSTCFNFYNNWHIGSVSFFLRPDVQHFLRTVNDSGHILNDRWGDSTIQAYAVRLFMLPQSIRQVPNFEYYHGSHQRVVSTVGDGRKTNVPQKLKNWKYYDLADVA